MDCLQTSLKNFEAKIYVGFKEMDTGIIHSFEFCEEICQDYVDKVGLCVTITPTKYIYTKGNEPGAIIGLIQYPRFPDKEENIKKKTLDLAELLMLQLGQFKVTVNFPDEVVMLSNPNL